MKVLGIIGTFLFVYLWTSPVSATIYTWTDENGVVHFTNYAPPSHAQVIVEDVPGRPAQEGDTASGSGTDQAFEDRLQRAEARANDLEQSLNQAQEKAQALEESLAEANRRAQEALRIEEAVSRSDTAWEEEYATPVYYSPYDTYGYSVVPHSRPIIARKPHGRYPYISHYDKGRDKKHGSGRGPREGDKKHRSNIGRVDARTQSERVFNQSRRNPFQSNFVNRRYLGLGGRR